MIGRRSHTDRRGENHAAMVAFAVACELVVALFLPVPVLSGTIPGAEEAALMQAAREYLDAEMRQDYPAVYRCFAPSSPYVHEHTYDDYLRDARASEDRVVAYAIVGVTYVHDNEDMKKWPAVERFAQVEVEMTFLHIPTDRRSEINIGFIFFKEGGKWYKS
jgi:hypothetical protein